MCRNGKHLRGRYSIGAVISAQGDRITVNGDVFINYRESDSRSYGALLYLALAHHFGSARVFLDSESIPAGADYAAELLSRVRRARVLLAVIGPRWLSCAGVDGGRPLHDPADWVRRELVVAFDTGVRVIPVLTDDAILPDERDLPTDIAALGRCQYRRLRSRDAMADLARLIMDLAPATPGGGAAAVARRETLPRCGCRPFLAGPGQPSRRLSSANELVKAGCGSGGLRRALGHGRSTSG
jgi:hypothetical protein